MTDSPKDNRDHEKLQAALRREQRKAAELEARLTGLENELSRARNRLDRLSARRSVRLALKVAALGRPVVDAVRRLRREPEQHPQRDAATIAAAIKRLRPDPGLAAGPLVTIVMLNRNGARHLSRVLPSLRDNTTYRSFELIVVDNGSSDESLDLLERDWEFPLQVIANEGNESFSRGCNQGIAAAKGDYVLLLNNDVEPITSGWLGHLVIGLEEDPSRGAAGALLVYPERPDFVSRDPNTGPDLTVQHRGIGFRWRRNAPPEATVPWAYNLGVGEDPTQSDLVATEVVPAATAACLLVKTALLRELGGFDEAFTYGMEDVDLCVRIRRAGHNIVLVGNAALFHHEFGTQSEGAAARKRAYGLANLQHFSEKWGPILSRLLQLEALSLQPRQLRAAGPTTVAITVTRDDPQAGWGDWYTAHELGDALEQLGYSVIYAERHQDRWYDLPASVSVVICLLDSYDARKAPSDALTVAWVRNWTDRWIDRPWFGVHDVYVPSSGESAARLAAAGVVVTPIIPLATNDARFYPRPRNSAYENDFVVTSNYWKAARPGIEEIIVRPGESFSIYGSGWEDVPRLSRYVRGHLPYEELAEVYSSTKIVVDETATPTLPYGAINSRVFDAAACGALVITNNAIGSDELFDGGLPVYHNPAEQRELLDRYLSNDDLRKSTAEKVRARVLASHTYERRAEELPAAVRTTLLRPRIAIKIGSPDAASAQAWGDTHFAAALQRSLQALGATTQTHFLADWETPAAQCVDVVVHVRGLGSYVPKRAHKNLLWIISHPDEVTAEECDGYDRVLVASEVFARELEPRINVPVEVMYQATDPDRFAPAPDPELAVEVLFVGNSRHQDRMAVRAALEIGAPLTVYGQDWHDRLPGGVLAAEHFPNEKLGALYSSAGVTLNDHWPEMAAHGFISNRVFDIIASGGVVFTDPVEGLDGIFGGLVPTFRTPAELGGLLEQWGNDREGFHSRMADARSIVLEQHTFSARAARILAIVDELNWTPIESGF